MTAEHPDLNAVAERLGYELGTVIWLSTDEDSGPDVGMTLGLGDGRLFYFGELADVTLKAGGIDKAETGDGWWIALESENQLEPVALIHNADAARDLFDALTAITARAALRTIAERGAG